MVVSNYPNWARIFRQIGRLLFTFFGLGIVAVLIDRRGHILSVITIPEMAVSVLGAALSILLAFRTNSAYGRWWEARTLWGSMVNSSRSLARQATSFSENGHVQTDEGLSRKFPRELVYNQIAFVHATRCSLRREAPWQDVAPFLDERTIEGLRSVQNVPDAILQRSGRLLASAAAENVISDWELHRIDQTLSDLSNVLGACERIKNTPLPRQYDFYPEFMIKIYCLVLPFIIVDEVGLVTPVITVLIGFAFLVLNRIGKNLEDPFENKVYDVPMTALSRTIEINLRQALGERDVPVPLTPVKGILM